MFKLHHLTKFKIVQIDGMKGFKNFSDLFKLTELAK